jgi:hypothetical protein
MATIRRAAARATPPRALARQVQAKLAAESALPWDAVVAAPAAVAVDRRRPGSPAAPAATRPEKEG